MLEMFLSGYLIISGRIQNLHWFPNDLPPKIRKILRKKQRHMPLCKQHCYNHRQPKTWPKKLSVSLKKNFDMGHIFLKRRVKRVKEWWKDNRVLISTKRDYYHALLVLLKIRLVYHILYTPNVITSDICGKLRQLVEQIEYHMWYSVQVLELY